MLHEKQTICAFFVFWAILVVPCLRADDIAWSAGGGTDTNWSNPNNWSGGSVPYTSDDATFNLTGTRTVAIGEGDQIINNLTISNS